jgi:hypothetical protein
LQESQFRPASILLRRLQCPGARLDVFPRGAERSPSGRPRHRWRLPWCHAAVWLLGVPLRLGDRLLAPLALLRPNGLLFPARGCADLDERWNFCRPGGRQERPPLLRRGSAWDIRSLPTAAPADGLHQIKQAGAGGILTDNLAGTCCQASSIHRDNTIGLS